MKYWRNAFLILSAFVFCLPFLVAGASGAAAASREVPVHVSPDLQALGVKATTATTLDAGAPGNSGSSPAATVFVTFDKPLYGVLHLRGYARDNTEVARSDRLDVNKRAEAGGHIRFSFDAPTDLTKVARFSLMGEKREGPPPPAKEESFGEEAKNIVKELLE